MTDFDRIRTLHDFRQVTRKSDTRHLRSVAVSIVSAPPRFDSMHIASSNPRGKQRVLPIDTRIEQANVGRLFRLLGKLCSCKEFVKPRTLFVRVQSIKELRRLLRPSQLGNAVERNHRALHVFESCLDQQDGTLGKSRLTWRRPHSLGFGSPPERVRKQRLIRGVGIGRTTLPRQPYLPPQRAFLGGRKRPVVVSPKRPNACHPDLLNGVDQTPVVTRAAGAVPFFLQIVADKAFEMTQLAVGDEYGSERAIFAMAHIQQFDALAFSRQALESQLDVRETFEFDLEAKTLLKPDAPLDLSGGVSGVLALFYLA